MLIDFDDVTIATDGVSQCPALLIGRPLRFVLGATSYQVKGMTHPMSWTPIDMMSSFLLRSYRSRTAEGTAHTHNTQKHRPRPSQEERECCATALVPWLSHRRELDNY